MLHLLEEPVEGHITEDRSRKKPNTRWLSNPEPLEFCSVCLGSTTVLQPLPIVIEVINVKHMVT